jgi:hypothetical protein
MSDAVSERLKKIEEQLDEALIERLALHADNKMKGLYWQGVLGGSAPGGFTGNDFVKQAVEKTLKWAQGIEGGRTWNYQEQPDLFLHLKSIIDSDLNHAAESWENRKFLSEAAMARTDEDGQEFNAMTTIAAELQTPSEDCINAEVERARERLLFQFFDFLSNDPQLQKVLELLFDGITKSAEQARRLGISDNEMYVVTKRLSRQIEKFKQVNAKTITEARAHA